MADERKEMAHTIVHVRPAQATGQASTFEARLARAQLPVRTFTDVYRALAYLLRSRRSTLSAIIVNVDGLGSPELEFFTILARQFPGLDVCVYGGARAGLRLDQAVKCGARCRLTDELLGQILSATQNVADMPKPAPEPVQEISPATMEPIEEVDVTVTPIEPTHDHPQPADRAEPDSLRSEDHQESEAFTPPSVVEPETKVSADAGDAGDAEPARVPWLNYHDRPQRAAPSQREPAAKEGPPLHERPAVDLTAPLLTDEEIQALLADDIASIAPGKSHPDAAGPSDSST